MNTEKIKNVLFNAIKRKASLKCLLRLMDGEEAALSYWLNVMLSLLNLSLKTNIVTINVVTFVMSLQTNIASFFLIK